MRIAAAILLASVSLAAIGHPAAAQDSPQAPTQIRVVPYSPLLRTEIVGVIGQPTTITFPPGESVYRVVQTGRPDKSGALADAGWQGASPAEIKGTPLGNNLTLWPVMPGESTMTVITMSSAGAQKVYPFRLLARPDSDGAADAPGVVLNLIFKGGAASDPATPGPEGCEGPGMGGQAEGQAGGAGGGRGALADRRLQRGGWRVPLPGQGKAAEPDRAALPDGQRAMDLDAVPGPVREAGGLCRRRRRQRAARPAARRRRFCRGRRDRPALPAAARPECARHHQHRL